MKNQNITKQSKLFLIDLAGSERYNKTKVKSRLKEACSINKSLAVLGSVIH